MVIYTPTAGPVSGATARLDRYIKSQLAAAAAAAAAAGGEDTAAAAAAASSSDDAAAAAAGNGTSTATAECDAADLSCLLESNLAGNAVRIPKSPLDDDDVEGADTTGPVPGIVLNLSKAPSQQQATLRKIIKQASFVQAMIPDLYVSAQVAKAQDCKAPSALSQGQSIPPSTRFKWAGCLTSSTKLRWIGRRCTPKKAADMSGIEYMAIIAISKSNNALAYSGTGKNRVPCIQLRPAGDSPDIRNKFGVCGLSPAWARGLASCVTSSGASTCVEPASLPAPDGSPTVTTTVFLKTPVTCGGKPYRSLTYTGTSCDSSGVLLQWTRARSSDGCLLTAFKEPVADGTQALFNNDVFGACGVPPGNASEVVANTICQKPVSPSPPPPPVSPSPPPPPPESPSPSPEPSPSPSPEPSPSPSPDLSPSPSPDLSPSPSPLPVGVLPHVTLGPSEQVPAGVKKVGSWLSGGIVDITQLPNQDVVVGVIDSGVDANHKDINYVGGLTYTTPSPSHPGDSAEPGIDHYGHGTHVAGIIGARNQGEGVVGVAPGVGIYSLKVLDGNGRGSLSKVLAAVNFALSSAGQDAKIRVINLSLSAFVEPTDPDYADTKDYVCGVMQAAVDAGIIITVAAGNYGSSIRGYLPASCPQVATVTAIDNIAAEPASYSNFMELPATDEETRFVIAAPGSAVMSTMSYERDTMGYKELSGTSMASPHVAGVAALCYMSGHCGGANGIDRLQKIKDAAVAERATGVTAFKGDATASAQGRYFGYQVWADF